MKTGSGGNSFRLLVIVLLSSAMVAFGCAVGLAKGVLGPLDRPAFKYLSPQKMVLLSVTRAGSRLVAVGEDGLILLSDDNGSSWRQVKSPVSVTLTSVRFASPRQGWVVGHMGVVLHSADGGETWVKQLDGRQADQLVMDAAKARAKQGGGDAAAVKQELENAKMFMEGGPDNPFLDILCQNEKVVFIVGAYNLIFRTVDGGKNWQPWLDHLENPEGYNLYGIGGSGDELYIAGEKGLFLRSKDDGQKFTAQSTPYKGSFFGLLVPGGGNLVLFGLRGNAVWSGDDGKFWQKIDTGVNLSISGGAKLQDGNLVLVSQGGKLLLSKNQGRTFELVDPDSDLMSLPAGVVQAANGNLVVVGMDGVTVIPRKILAKAEGR